MAVAEQFDRSMTIEEVAATVLLDHPELGNGWLVGCGRDAGFVVGRVVSEHSKLSYFFSIDPVAMVLDELVELDGVERRDIL